MDAIAIVNEEERLDIIRLYKRREVLSRLMRIAESKGVSLNGNIEIEYSDANQNICFWWDCVSKKYSLKKKHLSRWTIEFKTGEIYLID